MAILKKVEQQTNNKFLNMYNLSFYNKETNKEFNYFIASRKDKNSLVALHKKLDKADAVMMFCMYTNGDIVLIRQFRPAINNYIYESPAGLIDEGETILEAAKREVYEETGLAVIDCFELVKPSYTSEGISDESVAIYMCLVDGEPTTEHAEENEDIEVVVVKAADIDKFLKEETVSIKTALLMLNVKMLRYFELMGNK